ncbi:MAG: hypothetical protein NTY51_14825 [Deltaproteobacteria bacterium]|nr:hypothetical protein [Deltaproteobacteria bacterium]
MYIAVLACATIGVRFCNLGDCLTSERLNAAFHLVRPRGILIHTDMESKKSVGSGGSFKAFVKLRNSHEPSPDFARDLMEFVRTNMKTEILNLVIEIVKNFPVLSSRRLLRRVLLARELGLPVGDISRLRE